MLINHNTEHVKFVSYTGKYPNLCRGILTLEIDGAQYTFGCSWLSPTPPDFKDFWRSGGRCSFDSKWHPHVSTDEWLIDSNDLPEQFQKYAAEIDVVFNENVEHGCCGGCI